MLYVICFDTFAYPQLYFIILEEKMQAQINWRPFFSSVFCHREYASQVEVLDHLQPITQDVWSLTITQTYWIRSILACSMV